MLQNTFQATKLIFGHLDSDAAVAAGQLARAVLAGRGCKGSTSHSLGGLVELVLEFGARFASAAKYAGCGNQKQRRRDKKQNHKPSKDSNDLSSMPKHRQSWVSKHTLTLSGIIVAQQEVILEWQHCHKIRIELRFEDFSLHPEIRGRTSKTRVCNACTSSGHIPRLFQ